MWCQVVNAYKVSFWLKKARSTFVKTLRYFSFKVLDLYKPAHDVEKKRPPPPTHTYTHTGAAIDRLGWICWRCVWGGFANEHSGVHPVYTRTTEFINQKYNSKGHIIALHITHRFDHFEPPNLHPLVIIETRVIHATYKLWVVK